MLIKRYNTKEIPWSEGVLGFSNKSIFQAEEQYLLFNFHAFGDQDQSRYTKYMHEKYPYANVYKFRKANEWSKLGGIDIFGNGQNQRYIVNMYTQMYSGRPQMLKDQFPRRMKFFIHAMFKVYKIKDLKSIALQQKMADMAYYWPQYLEVIKKFAAKFPKVRSVIYQGNFISQARAQFRMSKRQTTFSDLE